MSDIARHAEDLARLASTGQHATLSDDLSAKDRGLLVRGWENYQLAARFHCSPGDIAALADDVRAMYLSFLRGEQDGHGLPHTLRIR